MLGSLDDATQLRAGRLAALALRDVDECTDDTVDDVLDASVRPDMQDESPFTALPKTHFALDIGERAQHPLYVGLQLVIVEHANELGDGPSAIRIAQVQKFC